MSANSKLAESMLNGKMKSLGISKSSSNRTHAQYKPSRDEHEEMHNESEPRRINTSNIVHQVDSLSIDAILSSLENLKVKDLKKVHSMSRELLEEYFKELEEVLR